FDIREAANGQQAIDAVHADPPNLIFMDDRMPVMDGWEATKRIRDMDGSGDVRIIALAGGTMAGETEKALARRCDDYLTKPVMARVFPVRQPLAHGGFRMRGDVAELRPARHVRGWVPCIQQVFFKRWPPLAFQRGPKPREKLVGGVITFDCAAHLIRAVIFSV